MWKVIAIVSFILMAGLYSAVYYLDRDLSNGSGQSTLSLQLVRKVPEAQMILQSWDADQKIKAEAALAVDFAFMFLGYSLFFFSVSRLLDSNILSVFAWLPVVFDSTENFLHLAAVQGMRPDLVTASFHITIFKFLCILIYLALFLFVVITKLLKKRKKNA
jgi:hypothetical protein